MMEQELYLEQQQVLSLEQRQSLQILAYSNQELNAFMEEEYLQNPLLECTRDRESELIDNLEKTYEQLGNYRDYYLTFHDDDFDRSGDIRALEESPTAQSLLDQLHAEDFSANEWELIGFLVQCLDEKGFFTCPVEEIVEVTHFREEDVHRMLAILRELEPVGIFSASVEECLLQQIRTYGIGDELFQQTVQDFLPELLAGKISTITRRLHISTATVREYVRLIGSLNPWPLMSQETTDASFIVPDILASWEDGEWVVSLNDGWMGEYRFSDYYLSMMHQADDPELKQYFREKYQRCRFLLEAVERRRKTILDTVKTILSFQEAYFLTQGALRPMTMEDVAKRLSLHPSTVSRAIRNKYLQCNARPVLLRDLFSTAASKETSVSADAVFSKIRSIIDSEDRSRPYSDGQIAEMLEAEGMTISRRTVAKYRKQLQIPDSRKRAYLPGK